MAPLCHEPFRAWRPSTLHAKRLPRPLRLHHLTSSDGQPVASSTQEGKRSLSPALHSLYWRGLLPILCHLWVLGRAVTSWLPSTGYGQAQLLPDLHAIAAFIWLLLAAHPTIPQPVLKLLTARLHVQCDAATRLHCRVSGGDLDTKWNALAPCRRRQTRLPCKRRNAAGCPASCRHAVVDPRGARPANTLTKQTENSNMARGPATASCSGNGSLAGSLPTESKRMAIP